METVKLSCVSPAFGLNIQECGGQWICQPGGTVSIPRTVYEDMKRRNALSGIKVVGESAAEPEKAAGRPKGGGKKSGPSPFAEDTDPTAPPEPEPEAPAETEPEPQPVEEQ